LRFHLNKKDFQVTFTLLDKEKRLYQCDINGHRLKLSYFKDASTNSYNLFVNDKLYEFKLAEPKYIKEQSSSSSGSSDSNDSVAPMPGIVDRINVKVGDKVRKGDPLVVMIAMKMEYVIKASRDGVVKSVNCSVGQNVKKAHKLVTLSD
jgi:3-methylcrotonyl-CoA carboxylase alpha subunit